MELCSCSGESESNPICINRRRAAWGGWGRPAPPALVTLRRAGRAGRRRAERSLPREGRAARGLMSRCRGGLVPGPRCGRRGAPRMLGACSPQCQDWHFHDWKSPPRGLGGRWTLAKTRGLSSAESLQQPRVPGSDSSTGHDPSRVWYRAIDQRLSA